MNDNVEQVADQITQEEWELIRNLRPYMSADDEGVPFAEQIQLLADRVKEDQEKPT